MMMVTFKPRFGPVEIETELRADKVSAQGVGYRP
jgi:hypothetical protein